MAVSSLKGCLLKLSARIRDYIDVAIVDSQPYRPADDSSAADRVSGDELRHPSQQRLHQQHLHHHHHHHDNHAHPAMAPTAAIDHKQSSKRSHKDRRNKWFTPGMTEYEYYQRLALEGTNKQGRQQQSQQRIQAGSSSASRSASVLGYTKRKTNQGQVYFVDQRGHKFWHDPSVPKEILNANLDLEHLVGPLPSNWEVSRTTNGKVYYINHTKKSTQFTDPRLIIYKDFLMSYLRHHHTPTQEPATNDLRGGEPDGEVRHARARLPLSPSKLNSQSQRDTNRTRATDQLSHTSSHRRNSALNNSAINVSIAVSVTPHNQCHRELPRENEIIGGTLNTRGTAGRHGLLMGSVQNLSNSAGSAGNSNTLTGPPPRWFADYPELVAPTLSNLRKQVAKNRSTGVASLLTRGATSTSGHTATETISPTQPLSPSSCNTTNNLNNSQNNCQTCPLSACLPPIYEPNKGNTDANKKEFYDKISLLRQELLKQQVLSHPCRIDINRKRIFEESFRAVTQLQARDLKKRLLIKFRGEEGLDYGGVAREWFYLLSREILNPVHGLFQYTGGDNYSLQINPDSGIVYREHLAYMNFCGRIIGMAVFHGHFIEGRFTLPFYKMLLGKPISLPDIEFVDPDLHRSLCWILNNDITDVIDTTFLVQHNAFGELQEHELKLGGRNLQVTEENKYEYVSLYVNYRCRRGIESQFSALQRGFHELIQPHLVECFDEQELELLIGGLSKINLDDWRFHTKLKHCTTETSLVRWFWDIVKNYDEDKRARLLQFVTGSPRVPIQGFKALQGVNSEPRLFTIHLIRNGDTDNLPKSHTCFNRIDLPPYETYDKLRDKLTQAIEETMGFAMQ